MDSSKSQTQYPLSLRERVGERGPKKLLQRARSMRTNGSEAEKLLWKYLRGHRFYGYKFRRQVVIEPYIVDFLCLEARLIIEADGGQHYEQESYDRQRTRSLESMGYNVIRFWNHDILNETAGVLEEIRKVLFDLSPSPQPSP